MRLQLSVDRVEEGLAVLFPWAGAGKGPTGERNQILWPVALLPPGAREGKILTLEVSVDEEATSRARRGLQDLVDELERKSREG